LILLRASSALAVDFAVVVYLSNGLSEGTVPLLEHLKSAA
jgi:hypothetical protein